MRSLLLLFWASIAAQAKPLWFNRMKKEDKSGLLRSCSRRKGLVPKQGERCSETPKLCYFGTQDCDGIGPHPVEKCFCDGKAGSRTWDCQNTTCPTASAQQMSSCPSNRPGLNVGCATDLECSYKSATTMEDGSSCTETTKCACTKAGSFSCEVTAIGCVSANPPSINPPSITDTCPDGPPGANVGCTTDLECSYKSDTTMEDGSACTETTKCACSKAGSFSCEVTDIGCVSANPPSITDACPDGPPGANVGCTTDLECSYKSATTMADGSACTETTKCSCTKAGSFNCEVTDIGCVSANPP